MAGQEVLRLVMPDVTRTIVLLARAPSIPGKTRLTDGLAPDAAEALRRALLLDTFEVISAVDAPIIVAFTPAKARSEIVALLNRRDVSFVAQRGTDLGSRMRRALDAAFDRGSDAAVLVGSDLPTLPVSHIGEAFSLLESGRDLVLGPAADGGYYLIGMRRPACGTDIFTGVEWGTANVLATTQMMAERSGLSVALAPAWYDVDTPVDLTRISRDAKAGSAPHTREWIRMYRT
jgi:uncharacterized protein